MAKGFNETDKTRFREIAERAVASVPANVVQLKFWPDDRRGAPNTFLRSALFSAGTPTNNRKTFKDHPIHVLGATTVLYTGPQLYQPDLDVWLELVHRCRLCALGTEASVHPRSVLKALGRSTGKSDYRWLVSSFSVLRATGIHVKQTDPATGRQRGYIGGLVDALGYDFDRQVWSVRLDARIASLFAPNEHTWLQSSARLALGRGFLAKWLHGYYATHREPLPVSVKRFQELSGSSTKQQLRDFRRAVRRALEEIASVERAEGRVFDWHIDEQDQVRVTRGR